MPDYNVFPDYKTRKEIINELCDRYKFIKHCFAGKSVCGRGIDVLHIGNTKNRVLYCGGFHGSEYLTILALLKFFEECCEAMESDKTVGGCKIGNFLSIRGLTIVPCVNPDGTEIALHGSDAAFKYKPLVEKAKAERLDYGQSLMTHAMVFQGVNLDENGKPNRWRVENSWGKEPGKDGYYLMTDRWFDEYMYQVVVNKKYLTAEQITAYEAEPIALEPWDPMGSLAVVR